MYTQIKTLRRLLLFFIIALALSGLTAIPVEQELGFLCRVFPTGTVIGDWLDKVYRGFRDTNNQYSFLAYGYDWLAFAHFVLAILFYGPLKDPVKNKWVIEFGLIACVLIIPFALVAGHFRGIPFWWRLIDCSFGVVGFFLLIICLGKIRKLEEEIKKNYSIIQYNKNNTMETFETIQSKPLSEKNKLFLKSIIIFVMALALWLPTHLILDIVKERAARQKEAIADISSKWADKQIVVGPILVVPYMEPGGNQPAYKRKAYFMPDKLDIQSKVFPEKRHRGIYEVAVYRSEIKLSGTFDPLKWQQLGIPGENILWNEAVLIFKVVDNVKGINEDLYINWDGAKLIVNPQSPGPNMFKDAFGTAIPFTAGDAANAHSFSLNFSLNGSEQLLFSALARENKIKMQSDWSNPSFTGIKLPDTREVGDSGFVANWKFMNRTIPLVWKEQVYDLQPTLLGADLLITVDSYDKTERSVKYALLCIILTFAAFFLIETIYKKQLHLVQYGLAGLALVLFYTLLLSVSEYTGFNPAYLIAAIATIGLVTWYVGGVMKSSKLALFISFVLGVVYAYIFTIIQLQDYSLLMGSIGLFIALGIIMFFSRKLQW